LLWSPRTNLSRRLVAAARARFDPSTSGAHPRVPGRIPRSATKRPTFTASPRCARSGSAASRHWIHGSLAAQAVRLRPARLFTNFAASRGDLPPWRLSIVNLTARSRHPAPTSSRRVSCAPDPADSNGRGFPITSRWICADPETHHPLFLPGPCLGFPASSELCENRDTKVLAKLPSSTSAGQQCSRSSPTSPDSGLVRSRMTAGRGSTFRGSPNPSQPGDVFEIAEGQKPSRRGRRLHRSPTVAQGIRVLQDPDGNSGWS